MTQLVSVNVGLPKEVAWSGRTVWTGIWKAPVQGRRFVRQLNPESYALDAALLARPGNDEIQLDLFLDYRTNVALYPRFQEYFRTRRPPLLATWGRNDPIFLPAGAEAFERDIPDAEVRLYETGHFALETHVAEIGAAIRHFLARRVGMDDERTLNED
jgi:pimeloyl-ACP methyl ester carboxylesterase